MGSFEPAIAELLSAGIARGASDIHIEAGQRGFLRVQGELYPYGKQVFSAKSVQNFFMALTLPEEPSCGGMVQELDFSWSYGERRFRVNAFRQRQGWALALRLLPAVIPSREVLGCPAALYGFLRARTGLLLVTGRTGSGKTSTLAAFLAAVHQQRAVHIITLEDPVEYLYPPGQSLISQRELGRDFRSFGGALRSALREDPDILLVGEIRDEDTLRAALDAGDTGHLVLGSLHTGSAAEAVLRMENLVPADEQLQLREQLAMVLSGIFSQQLLPGQDGKRVCACEVLLATPAVRNLIRTGHLQQLSSAMLSGRQSGMQTMEMAIQELLQQGRISKDVASGLVEGR